MKFEVGRSASPHESKRAWFSKTLPGLLLFSAIFAGFALLAVEPARALDTPNALGEVKATVDQALQILSNPEYKSAPSERREKLRSLVGDHFDFMEMSRSALGPHWKDLSAEQHQEFANLFKQFMEDSYLGKLDQYNGQKVEYLKEISEGEGYSQVNTSIVGGQNQTQPITVNYRMKLQSGTWRTYDVIIDGISLVGNYRNQFNRVINNQGYDALVKNMQQKLAQLEASSGQ